MKSGDGNLLFILVHEYTDNEAIEQ